MTKVKYIIWLINQKINFLTTNNLILRKFSVMKFTICYWFFLKIKIVIVKIYSHWSKYDVPPQFSTKFWIKLNFKNNFKNKLTVKIVLKTNLSYTSLPPIGQRSTRVPAWHCFEMGSQKSGLTNAGLDGRVGLEQIKSKK